jgi:hypothetical protein
MIDEAGGAPGAARINTHAYVIVRHPLFRIDHFPALIKITRSGGDVRMLFRHALPCARISVLEGETFRVRSVAEDDGKLSVFHGAKNIGSQYEAVVHRDRHIPIDPHPITDLGALLMRRHLRHSDGFGGQATEHEKGRKSVEARINASVA